MNGHPILWPWFIFVLGILGMGCQSVATDHLLLGNEPRSLRPSKSPIKILSEPPNQPYVKIAMVEAVEQRFSPTWEDLRQALLDEARAVGADAIINLRAGSEPYGALVGNIGASGTLKKLTGIAIRYK